MSTSLIQAIQNCEVYRFYGFRGNFCTWEWNWTLDTTESIMFHVFMCILYVVSVYFLQQYCKSPNYKQPNWLDNVKFIHNIALSLVSFWMFAVLLIVITMDGRLNSWHNASCKMTEMKGWYGLANFVFMISKIWEWLDTYFLVLSGKKVIFLHWFHHMTTFTLGAVTHNFPSGGFTLINCFIHTIMYMHYAKPLRWARPFITSGQIIQFIIVMTIHSNAFINPTTCYDTSKVTLEWLYCIVDVFIIFIYFSIFFIEEYIGKQNKKSKAKVVKKE